MNIGGRKEIRLVEERKDSTTQHGRRKGGFDHSTRSIKERRIRLLDVVVRRIQLVNVVTRRIQLVNVVIRRIQHGYDYSTWS